MNVKLKAQVIEAVINGDVETVRTLVLQSKGKTCSCGKHYNERPANAKLALDAICPGYYFNCTCHSTLIWPAD